MGHRMTFLSYTWKDLWQQQGDFALWQCILIGLFFFLADGVMCATNWYVQVGIIGELGYPKRTKREKRKGILAWIRSFSPSSRIFLWDPCRQAPKQGFFLWLAWFCNLLNLFSAVAACVGLIISLMTMGSGSGLLLLCVPYAVFLLTTAVEFLPGIIFQPSERNRYRWKK